MNRTAQSSSALARRGERNASSKLTDDAVRQIIALSDGGMTQAAIGKQFSVTASAVSQILAGSIWTHVTGRQRRAPKPIGSIEERFWPRVEKGGPPHPALQSPCWIWTGRRSSSGYGRLKADRKSRVAHRVAWELMNGPIPPGLLVCHHCDNPPCCNPAHLFLGTNDDNMADMVAKGRAKGKQLGNQSALGWPAKRRAAGLPLFSNPCVPTWTKLSDDDVREIRRRYAAGESPKDIAKIFRVESCTVTKIGRRQRRAAVADDVSLQLRQEASDAVA